MATTPNRLVTVQSVAERLNVNELTVRRMISRGELTGYKVGPRLLRLDADEVDAYIQPVPVGSTAGYVKKSVTIDPGHQVEPPQHTPWPQPGNE